MTISFSDTTQKSEYKRSIATAKPEPERVWYGKTRPEAYKQVYGTLRPVDTTDDKSVYATLFADGSGDHNKPLVVRTPFMVFPGVFSFDRPFLEFLRRLSTDLNRELPVDVDERGFSKTGIHTTFDRLRTVPNYYMNPMSYVAVDNARYREELGLRVGMTDREKAIAREFWHLIFSQAKVVPLNVPKKSTTGMRRFSREAQYKLDFAAWLFEDSKFEEMLQAVDREDWLELANTFETVFAMYMQKRGQVDQAGKERLVFDYEYAISGGARGTNRPADKRVVIDGTEYDDFSAMRARVVQAGPWTVNCYLQLIATTTMHAMFAEYPETFHVNTEEEIKAAVDGKALYVSDVTEYDRSMDAEDIELAHEVMAEYWDPRIVKASLRLYQSPYYARPLGMDGDKYGRWVGDPRDWKSKVKAGNRSGHALTSLMAKGQKVIDTLIVVDRLYSVLGRVKSFLKARSPMGCLNNGDDEATWSLGDRDIERFETIRENPGAGRYKVEREVGAGFSGKLICKTDVPRVYNPKPKIHTPFEKIWNPERAWNSPLKSYPTVGTLQRIQDLTATDAGRHAWDVHMSAWRDVMQPHYGDFMTILLHEHRKVDMRIEGLSPADREVLIDPDKLQYKYAADEIHPDVVNKVTSKIPVEVVERKLSRYYKGNIL